MSQSEIMTMDEIIGEIRNRFQVEGRPVPRCGGNQCCHCGEGCALGYPLVSELNGFGFGWKTLQKIWRKPLGPAVTKLYSAEFRTRWKARLGFANNPYFLPCYHSGCSFDHCRHLKSRPPPTKSGSEKTSSCV